jgi:hypothetical protein
MRYEMLRFPAVTPIFSLNRSLRFRPSPHNARGCHIMGDLSIHNTRVFIFPQYRFVALLQTAVAVKFKKLTWPTIHAYRKPETINTRRRYFSLFVTSLGTNRRMFYPLGSRPLCHIGLLCAPRRSWTAAFSRVYLQDYY